MRRFLLFAVLLIAAVPAAQSATIDINDQRERVRQLREAAARNRAANSGGAAGQTAATPPFCYPARTGTPGPISLLGVTSQMGPASGTPRSPVENLTSEHPAKQALMNIGMELGIIGDPEGASPELIARNAAARMRKSRADVFAQYLGFQESGMTFMADLFAWVYDGEMELLTLAHREQQEVARRYTLLYEAAEAEGRKCP